MNLALKTRFTSHFSPSRTPHFGGLWKVGIKSTKSHLKRIFGDHCRYIGTRLFDNSSETFVTFSKDASAYAVLLKRMEQRVRWEQQTRCRWKRNNQALLTVGTVATVQEENHPPYNWKLDRILQLHLGNDGMSE